MDWQVPGHDEIRELGGGARGRVVLASEQGGGGLRVIRYVTGDPVAFQKEAAALAGIDDPHVARVLFVAPAPEGADGAAIVAEAVEGRGLGEILAARVALEPVAALAVLKGSLLALATAHAAEAAHRDYRPADVIVRPDGSVELTGFGAAVPDEATGRVGTPAYTAPEQWTGGPATPATDLYAAACVFFECLTGARPYQATALADLQQQHQSASPPIERVPVALRSLTLRGLAKFPAQRPVDAAAFAADLEKTARRAYGRHWERDGRAALAGLVAGLGGSALAAGPAADAHAPRTGGSGLLGRIMTGRVALLCGVTGLAAIVAGGTAVYSSTQEEPPRPAAGTAAPTPTAVAPALVKVVFVEEDAPGEQVRIATVTGLPEPLKSQADATLRARVDALVRQSRAVPGGQGRPLRVKASLAAQAPGLVSVAYTLTGLRGGAASDGQTVSGARFAVAVDLASGREITASDVFPQTSLAPLARRITKVGQDSGGCLQEAPLRLTAANVGRVVEPVFLKKGMRITLHLAESGPAGRYSPSCRRTEELIPYRMLLDLMDPGFRAKLGR